VNGAAELTRRFTAEQFGSGLGSWGRLGLDGKVPVFASPFGDVFFEAADGIWWLDTLQGELSCPWQDPAALNIAGQLHEQVRDLPPGTPVQFA
jgi:hypothetical protein